jgi:hypothetical protein
LLLVSSATPFAFTSLSHIHSSAASSSGIGLAISARPQVLPADGGSYSAVVIQFVESSSNVPIVPGSDVTVYLSSSNAQTGTVPPSVTFPARDLYYSVNFTTTTLPGTTTIYAVAQGYQPASMTLKTETVGGIPTALEVFLSPDHILAQPGMSSSVVVEAVDAFGNPVKLGAAITVALSSSATQVGNVSSSLTIPTNDSYWQTTFSPTANPGQTVITASAGNLTSGSAVMTTVNSASTANTLAIEFAPPVLFSDGGTYQNMVVEITNSGSNLPATSPNATIVTLTSSSASVGALVQSIIEIPAGQTYAYASFKTLGLSGSTVITATASNFFSAQGTLILVTKAASTLGLYAVPGPVIADNQTYNNNLVVQLHDSSGNPEKTTLPVNVSLQSLDPTTGSVPSSVVIPAGSTFVFVPFTDTSTIGGIKIVAFASGFQLGQTTINTMLLNLNATIVPSVELVQPGGSSRIMLQVSSGGFPIQNASVQWVATSGHISPTSATTNGSGYSSAVVVAQTSQTSITVNARISAPGYNTHLVATTLSVNNAPSKTHQGFNIMTAKVLFIPVLGLIIAAAAAGGSVSFLFIRKRFMSGGDYGIDEEE